MSRATFAARYIGTGDRNSRDMTELRLDPRHAARLGMSIMCTASCIDAACYTPAGSHNSREWFNVYREPIPSQSITHREKPQ